MKRLLSVFGLAVVVLGPPARAATAYVRTGAHDVAVIWQGDVVIAGGSTGAVAAAATAAKAGCKVFLVEPFPYLGEDMTATLRLWLEDGERPDSPLARRIFLGRQGIDLPGFDDRLDFTYKPDLPSSPPHRDTTPPTVLNDGRWGSARSESVQYNGDPALTLELAGQRSVRMVHVLLYHRQGFRVAGIEAQLSADGRIWSEPVSIANSAPEQETVDEDAILLSLRFPGAPQARFVKVRIHRAPGEKRVLVGELVVVGVPGRGRAANRLPMPTPAHVKRVLTETLLASGVEFLLSAVPTDVVTDDSGRVCGLVFATRGGRFAVLGKLVVDATERARVARLAGCEVRALQPGVFTFERVVIGGAPRRGQGLTVRKIEPAFRGRPRKTDNGFRAEFPLYAYTLRLPLTGVGLRAFEEVEQRARDLTFDPEQETAGDVLFQVPPDPVVCRTSFTREWSSDERIPLDTARPKGVSGLLLLGGCMDVPRKIAARLLRPPALIRLGERLGHAAAAAAKTLPPVRACRIRVSPQKTSTMVEAGEARESIGELRLGDTVARLGAADSTLPVLAEYDVVVIGGGTAGAPAGIGAARRGARTLVVEMLHGLGGVGTLGAITKYYWGYRGGFTGEVPGGASWRAAQRREWWRSTLRKAGAEVWFGAMGTGALVDNGRVRGVVVTAPQGRGVVLARVVIDATGSADIAAAAGASCTAVGARELAVQGTGLPPLQLGADYINTDFTIADETDPVDLRRIAVQATFMARRAFDIGSLVDSRERRRIVGDYTLSPIDQILGRVFPDTIAQAWSNFDSHGHTTHPLFYLQAPDMRRGIRTWMPYRCLLPKGLDGILVVGLGVSAHRDALPGIRMQPDVQNLGYAAGVAAAMAARKGGRVRQINVGRLQREMIRAGLLPKDIQERMDAGAPDRGALEIAVQKGIPDLAAAARVLADPGLSRPLLRQALDAEKDPARRLRFAVALGFLGDRAGVPELVRALDAAKGLDKGWNYRSAGQFGRSISRLDQLALALGRSGDPRAVPALLRLAAMLTPQSAFSHVRCLVLAFEALRPPQAAPALARLLKLPGVRGHALTRLSDVAELAARTSFGAVTPRRNALREILLARALVRCGDPDGLGRQVLEEYTHDYRAYFARHAAAVLAEVDRR
ncbi:MAG: FAD-dependent oxidoreductase [Kiritimatiellaeota bacterium]|nr:FAD-dependent oxidoreductase [Kiritimatiellota bacterium]